MTKRPALLQKGDRIEILAPAKAIDAECVEFAQKQLENCGFNVTIATHCLGQHHYFSGTVDERSADFQRAINDPEVQAILCARGGYGCVQFVDGLDWSAFLEQPKWLIGFSDITVFHQRLQQLGVASIHGTMPLNFAENSSEALDTLIASITEDHYTIEVNAAPNNLEGKADGLLIGGNFSIIYSLLGTNGQPDYTNTILYIEDVGEPLYSIDRMFFSLKKAGILDQIKGLIVGGMTALKDSEIPFGKTYQEIVLSHVSTLGIPVCFDFPAGHIDDNRALRLGSSVQLEITNKKTFLRFIK